MEEHDGDVDAAEDKAESPSRKCARHEDQTDDAEESLPSLQVAIHCLIMVALCNRADHYIFILFLSSSSFFFFLA